MNRRVTFVTALSVAGTAAVAAMSFAIVYEPADDPSAGVPLLDTTLAVSPDASQGTDPAVGEAVLPGAAPLPTALNPAVPIAATPAAPTGATAPAAAPVSATPGQGSRGSGANTPTAPAAPTGAPTGVTTPAAPATAPATSPAASPSPTSATQPPVTIAAPATTAAPTATTATTTPAPATTVAARPEGVPADWPANRPIPPMPPGCVQPQLEDNGVWNCQ